MSDSKAKFEEIKENERPTLEEVKEYFKYAKEVICIDDGICYNISDKETNIKLIHGSFWKDDVVIWENYQYAEIVSYKDKKQDEIVSSVVNQFLQRSEVGIKKYGTTLKENNSDDFLQHLKEELMDAVLYIEKLQDERE